MQNSCGGTSIEFSFIDEKLKKIDFENYFLNFWLKNEENFKKSQVFRRHHVMGDPVNLVDPSGKNWIMLSINTVRRLLGYGLGTFVLGIFQDEGGNIGGTPLNQNEDFDLGVYKGDEARKRAGIHSLPRLNGVPNLQPVSSGPQMVPERSCP